MIFNSHKHFTNRRCEYYPCHDMDVINCLFCFCPLYNQEDCGGYYSITASETKDCSKCTLPHVAINYDYIINKLSL